MRSAWFLAALTTTLGCAHLRGTPTLEPETVRVGEAVFQLRYAPEDAGTARQVRSVLKRAVATAERWGTLAVPVVVTIHPTHAALEEAVHREGQAWLRGWARYAAVDLQSPRTWSTGSATEAQLLQIVTHEVTHCVMYQSVATGKGRELGIPLWFKEGLASVTAGQQHRRARPSTVRQLYAERAGAAAGSAEPELLGDGAVQALDADLAYAVAHLAFGFLVERHGDARVQSLLASMGEGHAFGDAFQLAIGMQVRDFEREFRDYVARG